MRNYLICWVKNKKKYWEMVKKTDHQEFLMELLLDEKVDKHTIFVVPMDLVSGIWLCPETHKSKRVDFCNFHEDFGLKYEKPQVSNKAKQMTETYKENYADTKYGWISPTGEYLHCEYEGHNSLADNICFGMIQTNNASRWLEEHGWIKIFKPLGVGTYSVFMGDECVANDEQIKTLEKLNLMNAHGISSILLKD